MQQPLSTILRYSTSAGHQIVRPTRWLDAVKTVPPKIILPPTLGGEGEQRLWKYAAWRGDKLLGAATATFLEQSDEAKLFPYNTSAGGATKLTNLALSNRFFAAHLDKVLPDYADEASQLSDKLVGTMLEATVASIHDIDAAAVSDLASFLVLQATEQMDGTEGKAEYIEKFHCRRAKTTLLNRGGTVEDATRIGGPNDFPVFLATATLKEQKTCGIAENKMKAECRAALELLKKMDDVDGNHRT